MYRIRVREDAQDLIPDAFQHLEVENGRRGNKGDWEVISDIRRKSGMRCVP